MTISHIHGHAPIPARAGKALHGFVGMLLCGALPTLAASSPEDAARNDFGGLRDGASWSLINRTVYDQRNYRKGNTNSAGVNAAKPRAERSDTAREWGYGLIGELRSGFTRGPVGLGLDALLYAAQRLGGNDDTAGKARLLPVDGAGHLQDGLVRGGLAIKARISQTVLSVGEQRVKTPVFAASDSRLLPESMRGWLLRSSEWSSLTLQAGHFTGSTDRNARSTDNALTVNYSAAERGRAYDFVGASYRASPDLTLNLYSARFEDSWRTHYAGASYTLPLAGPRSLGLDLQLYRSRNTGRALAGHVDNTTGSLMASYRHGPHRFGLGYQKVDGDTPFDYVSRGAIWLANAAQLSDFNGPHEASWQISYQFDFAALDLPGLQFGAAYLRGSGIDGSRADPHGGYAGLGYGRGGKHWERDLLLRYTVQDGRAKGLALALRYDVHRNNPAQAELNADRIRVSAEWPLSGSF